MRQNLSKRYPDEEQNSLLNNKFLWLPYYTQGPNIFLFIEKAKCVKVKNNLIESASSLIEKSHGSNTSTNELRSKCRAQSSESINYQG